MFDLTRNWAEIFTTSQIGALCVPVVSVFTRILWEMSFFLWNTEVTKVKFPYSRAKSSTQKWTATLRKSVRLGRFWIRILFIRRACGIWITQKVFVRVAAPDVISIFKRKTTKSTAPEAVKTKRLIVTGFVTTADTCSINLKIWNVWNRR